MDGEAQTLPVAGDKVAVTNQVQRHSVVGAITPAHRASEAAAGVTGRRVRADGAVAVVAAAGVVAAEVISAGAGDDSGIHQEEAPRD